MPGSQGRNGWCAALPTLNILTEVLCARVCYMLAKVLLPLDHMLGIESVLTVLVMRSVGCFVFGVESKRCQISGHIVVATVPVAS